MIEVNSKQKGNNLLNYISTSLVYFNTLATDYQPNVNTSILFLSLKFHISKPEYIHKRLKKIQYPIKILLISIDAKNYETILPEMHNIAFNYDHNLVLSFSDEESARYIKSFEKVNKKSVEYIRSKKDNIDDFLKSIPKITVRDVENIKKCGISIKELITRTSDEIKVIDGIGDVKCEIIGQYFDENFYKQED